jgi:hypothetical protein
MRCACRCSERACGYSCDVTVMSEPGKGSVFTVRLPVGADNLTKA